MANFKRGKPRRQCKCTLCTQWRWYGNSSKRICIRDRRKTQDLPKDLKSYIID